MCGNECLAIVCRAILQGIAQVGVALLIIFVSLYVALRRKGVRALILQVCRAIIHELEATNPSKMENATDKLALPADVEAQIFTKDDEESIDELLDAVYESDDALNQLIEKEIN